MTKTVLFGTIVAAILVAGIVSGATVFADDDDKKSKKGKWLISETTILNGLGAGALFPYIDTTPNKITRAHVALTDSTDCGTADPPDNIVILAGVAGGALEPVTLANTGIGGDDQCVFHATIVPGADGIPKKVTDIVVVNGGGSALTGFNTVTVSAEVRP